MVRKTRLKQMIWPREVVFIKKRREPSADPCGTPVDRKLCFNSFCGIKNIVFIKPCGGVTFFLSAQFPDSLEPTRRANNQPLLGPLNDHSIGYVDAWFGLDGEEDLVIRRSSSWSDWSKATKRWELLNGCTCSHWTQSSYYWHQCSFIGKFSLGRQ